MVYLFYVFFDIDELLFAFHEPLFAFHEPSFRILQF